MVQASSGLVTSLVNPPPYLYVLGYLVWIHIRYTIHLPKRLLVAAVLIKSLPSAVAVHVAARLLFGRALRLLVGDWAVGLLLVSHILRLFIGAAGPKAVKLQG